MTIQATLCFILHDSRVLLLKKNPGLFGAGKWNAPGGKVQPHETAEHCAIREVHEETGLEVRKPRKIGTLIFFKHDKHQDPGLDCTRIPHERVPGHCQEEQRGHSSMVSNRPASV